MSKEEIIEALKSIKIRCHSKSMKYDPIDFDLDIVEKSLKALEIIKEKPQAELSLIQLGKIKTYEEYLNYTNYWELDLYGDMVYTEEEFNLLKGILNEE